MSRAIRKLKKMSTNTMKVVDDDTRQLVDG